MWRYVRQSFVRHLSPANEAPPSPPSTSINPVVIATNNNNTAISTLVSASSSFSGNGSNSWKDNSKPVAAAAAFLFGTTNTSTSPSDANHSHRLPLHHDVSSHGTTPNDGASSSKTVGDDIMEPHVYPNTNRLLRIVRPRRKNYDDDNNNNEMDDVHTSVQCEEPTTTTTTTTTTKNNNDDNRSTTKTTIGNNKPNPTFRQRRMTLHPSHKRKDDDGGGEKDVITDTNTARKSTTSTTTVSNANSTVDNDNNNNNNNGDRIMYPIPMNIQKEEEADILSTRHHLHHQDERPSSSSPNDDKKKIASYSCNGIEPQHRLLVEDVPEEDEDENENFLPSFRNRFLRDGTLSEDGSSFLSRLLFGSSSRNDDYDGGKDDDDVRGTRSRRRTRLVTVVESKVNQDRGHVICPYGCQNDRGDGGGGVSSDGTIVPKTALFGIYDGHGEKGELLAEFTMNALSEKLKFHPAYLKATTKKRGERTRRGGPRNEHDNDDDDNDDGISTALRDAICTIDEELETRPELNPNCSGSTACIAILRDNELWTANVGDSRAVLARKKEASVGRGGTNNEDDDKVVDDTTTNSSSSSRLYAFDLTKDQNANDVHERERILRSGGHVTIPEDETLSPRVWIDEECTSIGLAMSRSVGDHALRDAGVIAEPVVRKYDVKDGDEFLIIASDGVWEFISSKESVEIVQKCFDRGLEADEACRELIHIAIKKWKEKEGNYRDDITAIVVRLSDFWNE